MANPGMEQQAFRAALDAAIRERAELDVLIEQLAKRVGVEVPAGSSTSNGPATPAAPDADPATLVADGEFFGMSATKATKALLEKLGRTRPLKSAEIFVAIKKGGVGIANIEVLYKSLARSNDFIRVAKGTWGLAAWYPQHVVRNARSTVAEEDLEILDDDLEVEPADSIGVQT